jgi:hypothetical protein
MTFSATPEGVDFDFCLFPGGVAANTFAAQPPANGWHSSRMNGN